MLTAGLFTANITADIFTAWVKQDLLPGLPENAVIVMDKATFHKRQDTQGIIRKAGHTLLFLPKYSPDLNPIEQVFAKLKHLLRKAAKRTADDVSATIGELLDTFTRQECSNYFKNSGYA